MLRELVALRALVDDSKHLTLHIALQYGVDIKNHDYYDDMARVYINTININLCGYYLITHLIMFCFVWLVFHGAVFHGNLLRNGK